jgi:hypothetical protein
MSTNLSSVPKLQFFDANGNPLVGGKLFTYAAGTTTPLATYTDSTGLTPNTNPIILDSRGEADVWLDATQYKFELKTAADALIWTVDNISNALNLSQLLASSGSAASPPYTFAADTTTGMFLAAAGQIGLSANGTPVLRSTDTQAVLDVNLQISGTARRITGDFSNATVADRVMFQTSTTNGNTIVAAIPNGTSNISGFQAYANSSGLSDVPFGQFAAFSTEVAVSSARNGTGTYLPMTFYTGGSERVRVDTSGNVGVGTNAPASRLHIRQDQDGTTREIIQNRNASGTPLSELAFITSTFDLSDNRYAYIQSGGGGSQYLAFGTGNGVAPTERMRIDSSGNVGIGTSSPRAQTHIFGAGQTTANLTDAGSKASMLRVSQDSSASGSGGAILFANIQSDTANSVGFAAIKGLLVDGSNNTAGDLAFSIRKNTSDTSLTECMRITSAGLFQYDNGYGSVATAFGCRAWVSFDGTAVTNPASATGIRGSGNVSSILDNGVGDYTINFTTAMPDTNFTVVSSMMVNDGLVNTRFNGCGARTTGTVRVYCADDARAGTDTVFSDFAVFR